MRAKPLATSVKGYGFKERNTPVAKGEELPAIRSTKKATGGNSSCDRDWLAEMVDDLKQVTKEDLKLMNDGQVYWDVLYQWNGFAEEVNPEFFDAYRRGTRNCTGVAYLRDERGGYILDCEGIRLQRPCIAMPALGANVCYRHGAQTPQVRAAAIARLSLAADKAATTLITLTDSRDEEGELVDQKVRVSAANSVLDRVGIKAGAEIEVNMPGYKKVLDSLFTDDNAPPSAPVAE